MVPEYTLRPATLADADALVHHRLAMFADMGVPFERAALDAAFRGWLAHTMPAGVYRAWLVETGAGEVAAGGGITVIAWPPGPHYPGDRLAFVYNMYTEPAHRHRGLARQVMDAIHAWCREAGIRFVALNASDDGRRLYEAMGYRQAPNPMMFLAL